MDALEIRPLVPEEADVFVRLRHEALEREPLAFASSLEDDRALDPVFVRETLADPSRSTILGAFSSELVGAVGVRRDAQRKAVHKAHVWGMYVRPDARRRGVGSALLAAAVSHARGLAGIRQVRLCVSETAQAALQLYLNHGFRI